MKTLVLLDLDGTLLSARGEGREAFVEALAAVFPETEFRSPDMAGRTDFGLWVQMTRHGEGPQWDAFQRAYLRILTDRLQRRPPVLLPGAMELCRALASQQDLVPGVVTGNLRASGQVKISAAGLSGFLQGVPAAWGDAVLDKSRQAIEAVGIQRAASPEEFATVVVGDTIADLECARTAGAGCLGVRTGPDQAGLEGCQAVVDDLSDTAEILQILRRIAR